jgi:hypothetical protein
VGLQGAAAGGSERGAWRREVERGARRREVERGAHSAESGVLVLFGGGGTGGAMGSGIWHREDC